MAQRQLSPEEFRAVVEAADSALDPNEPMTPEAYRAYIERELATAEKRPASASSWAPGHRPGATGFPANDPMAIGAQPELGDYPDNFVGNAMRDVATIPGKVIEGGKGILDMVARSAEARSRGVVPGADWPTQLAALQASAKEQWQIIDEALSGVKQHYVDRYRPSQFLTTAYEEPVSTAIDLIPPLAAARNLFRLGSAAKGASAIRNVPRAPVQQTGFRTTRLGRPVPIPHRTGPTAPGAMGGPPPTVPGVGVMPTTIATTPPANAGGRVVRPIGPGPGGSAATGSSVTGPGPGPGPGPSTGPSTGPSAPGVPSSGRPPMASTSTVLPTSPSGLTQTLVDDLAAEATEAARSRRAGFVPEQGITPGGRTTQPIIHPDTGEVRSGTTTAYSSGNPATAADDLPVPADMVEGASATGAVSSEQLRPQPKTKAEALRGLPEQPAPPPPPPVVDPADVETARRANAELKRTGADVDIETARRANAEVARLQAEQAAAATATPPATPAATTPPAAAATPLETTVVDDIADEMRAPAASPGGTQWTPEQQAIVDQLRATPEGATALDDFLKGEGAGTDPGTGAGTGTGTGTGTPPGEFPTWPEAWERLRGLPGGEEGTWIPFKGTAMWLGRRALGRLMDEAMRSRGLIGPEAAGAAKPLAGVPAAQGPGFIRRSGGNLAKAGTAAFINRGTEEDALAAELLRIMEETRALEAASAARPQP